MQKYAILGKKGEGTFSEVLKAQDVETKAYVAIKCMRKPFQSKEQVNRLREIQAVRRLQPHPNIVPLIEVMFDKTTGRLALVFELMDMNLYEFIRGRRHQLDEHCVMTLMYQLFKALDHAHRKGIFHRDIKPENILLREDGTLKLADFGSCRGLHVSQPLTEYVSTRWYRAPECLLTSGYYTHKMDLWAAGCVFFEIIALTPLFPGTTEMDQIHKIHDVLGTPPLDVLNTLKKFGAPINFQFSEKKGTGVARLLPEDTSKEAIDLIGRLLQYDEKERVTAKEALRHPYFKPLRGKERQERHRAMEYSTEKAKTLEVDSVLPCLTRVVVSKRGPMTTENRPHVRLEDLSNANGRISAQSVLPKLQG
ncbi:protein kinase, putative [Trypanosoma brucei gambiense DAL972]|uniref:Protein kinase, putative n=2 Tax=Trypanosoma brucei TaxID=5691 RepID=C9ZYF0_TRYB9|nr:protein kinase, putative [Trypanosoma brucei gambiense DAL972]RHW70410.1 protein kinase [Trypanosoma brucei equiperdum]CBH14449.1 protein kinase, putative [Trypanosoma brucei gambiense DAL972]|eukprot:XP_011776715.1 protein kinase, putative [Trypanosoma brucei gambiense DAL972]